MNSKKEIGKSILSIVLIAFIFFQYFVLKHKDDVISEATKQLEAKYGQEFVFVDCLVYSKSRQSNDILKTLSKKGYYVLFYPKENSNCRVRVETNYHYFFQDILYEDNYINSIYVSQFEKLLLDKFETNYSSSVYNIVGINLKDEMLNYNKINDIQNINFFSDYERTPEKFNVNVTTHYFVDFEHVDTEKIFKEAYDNFNEFKHYYKDGCEYEILFIDSSILEYINEDELYNTPNFYNTNKSYMAGTFLIYSKLKSNVKYKAYTSYVNNEIHDFAGSYELFRKRIDKDTAFMNRINE